MDTTAKYGKEIDALLTLSGDNAQQIMLGSHYDLIRERDALREALAGITMIRKLGDGSIAVGPRGWEIAQAVLAKVLSGGDQS